MGNGELLREILCAGRRHGTVDGKTKGVGRGHLTPPELGLVASENWRKEQEKKKACAPSLKDVSTCLFLFLWQYRIILSADTASEVRQLLSQKRR